MAFKIFVLFGALAVVKSASILRPSNDEPYSTYSFGYGRIDNKEQEESLQGSSVNGFNALVQRNPNFNGANVASNHESPTLSVITPISSNPIGTTATATAVVQPQIPWIENTNAGVYGIPDSRYRYQSWPNSLYDARAFVTNRYGYGTANVVRFD